MERIVVVTDGSKNDHGVIELLKALFPECEIQIVSSREKRSEAFPKDSLGGLNTIGTTGGNHD